MKNTNCPNCGAVIDTSLNKCPYCGTSYFDLTGIDFENHKPIYLKIQKNVIVDGKMQPITMTAKVIPESCAVTCSNEYPAMLRTVDIDVNFKAIRERGVFFTIVASQGV